MMTKVLVNGLGRVGRTVLKLLSDLSDVEVVGVNDINPSTANHRYLLSYDSSYGRFRHEVGGDERRLIFGSVNATVSCYDRVDQFIGSFNDIDLVIDATGVVENFELLYQYTRDPLNPRAIITHSYNKADLTLIYGVNDSKSEINSARLISTSICDAAAIAPVLSLVSEIGAVESGSIFTMHPWLSYQNLTDGPCRSFAYPGEFYENFALGRASPFSLIPKRTSCVDALRCVLPDMSLVLSSLSMRVPTDVVSCAVLEIRFENSDCITLDLVEEKIRDLCLSNPRVMAITDEALVSIDFKGCVQSSIVDKRWLSLDQFGNLRVVVWYDNEWGYCNRVVDAVMDCVKF